MPKSIAVLGVILLALLVSPAGLAQEPQSGPLVQSIDLDVTIDPASAAWVDQSLDDAKKAGAKLVVYRPPQPTLTNTRQNVQRELDFLTGKVPPGGGVRPLRLVLGLATG